MDKRVEFTLPCRCAPGRQRHAFVDSVGGGVLIRCDNCWPAKWLTDNEYKMLVPVEHGGRS